VWLMTSEREAFAGLGETTKHATAEPAADPESAGRSRWRPG